MNCNKIIFISIKITFEINIFEEKLHPIIQD